MSGGPRTLLKRRVGEVELEAVEGDITLLDVDAIVNAANDHLWMGAGVAGAIRRRGGEEVEAEAVSKGPIAVGEAVSTSAGDLPSRHVIHAAVMGQDLRTDLRIVEEATSSVLDLAAGMGLSSLAMPLLGTGVGGLSTAEVARTMVQVVIRRSRESALAGMRILMVGYGEEASGSVVEAVGSA